MDHVKQIEKDPTDPAFLPVIAILFGLVFGLGTLVGSIIDKANDDDNNDPPTKERVWQPSDKKQNQLLNEVLPYDPQQD